MTRAAAAAAAEDVPSLAAWLAEAPLLPERPELYPPGDRRWLGVRWLWCERHQQSEREDVSCSKEEGTNHGNSDGESLRQR